MKKVKGVVVKEGFIYFARPHKRVYIPHLIEGAVYLMAGLMIGTTPSSRWWCSVACVMMGVVVLIDGWLDANEEA